MRATPYPGRNNGRFRRGRQVTTPASSTTTPSGPGSNIAQPWYDAGVSVLPISPGGNKKPALSSWKALQSERMTAAQVDGYWGNGSRFGVALICGAVSGSLEMTELEVDATKASDLQAVAEECDLRGVRWLWDELFNYGYMEWTPSGGLHLIYRVEDHEIPGNTKLAMRLAEDDELNPEERRSRGNNPNLQFWRTRAETRGEGGYVVVAPTSGLCHSSGQPWIVGAGQIGEIPTITWEQRMSLHAAITSALDQTPPPAPAVPRQEVAVRIDGELRPGDDWENQHDWDEPWFTGQGWTVSHRVGTETFWVRPGKEARDGHSASTGYNGDKDRLYVWSTSTGLPTETPLSKFFVYSFYHYNGDMARAASALRRENYGSPATAAPSSSLMPWTPDDNHPVSLPPRGGLDLTDVGSGRRMKDAFGDQFRFNTREDVWYRWNGSAWVKDEHLHIWRAAVQCAEEAGRVAQQMLDSAELVGDDDMVKAAKKRLHDASQLKNKGKLEAAIKMFAVEDGMALTTDAFDSEASLLNLPNGTLELESQHLKKHDPRDLMTLSMGAELDKDAECPKFEQFMVEAFPDEELRSYVQRCLGYSLLGTAKERAIFVLFGPSGTGKSVLTNLMTRIFGSYGTTAPASTFRVKKQTETLDLHKLKGARFVATSELPEGAQLDEDLVKRISGGDLVTSRGHWEAFTEWHPSCVVWIATNHLPKLNGDDNAIWKRMKTIKMETEFCGPNEVLGYADVLYEEEASGILNWLLQGLEAYYMLGLDEPEAVRNAVENYRIDMNLAASFVRDKLEEGVLVKDEDFETRSSDVWSLFSTYCTENHQMPLGARRFQNQLKALGFEPTKIGGKAYWKGLRINISEHGVRGTIW
jgi:P4 family phage/plasmid primase-like protien